jgi:hypothetical protein
MRWGLPSRHRACVLKTVCNGRVIVSWDAVGAVAELVGAIGVVASLAYLGIQIRQNTHHIDFNTRAIRATTFQNFSNTFGEFEDLLLEHKKLGHVWVTGLTAAAPLEPDERILFNNLAHKFFRMYEALFLQYEAGLVEKTLFESAHRFPDELIERPGLQSYWERNRQRYADSFAHFISQRFDFRTAHQAVSPDTRRVEG